MNADTKLEVIDLQISFKGQPVVAGLTFTCTTGCIALIGDTGCGKSTTARGVARLLDADEGYQMRGDIRLDGESTWNFSPEEWRRRCVMVLQRPTAFPGSTEWNVAIALRESGAMREREVAQRVAGALHDVQLAEYAQKPATHLSGGQLQRLTIARALALAPPAIILDEPTASQSPPAMRNLAALVRQIASRKIVLVVSHDIAFVERVASHFLFLHNDGNGAEVRARGPVAELRAPQNPLLADFVGVPEIAVR